MTEKVQLTMTINGVGQAGAEHFDVINPAHGEVLAQAPDCTQAELDQAVVAAREAFPGWSAKSMEERGKLLGAMAAKINEHVDDLARLLTLEQGKPLADAQQEIFAGAYWLGESANQSIDDRVEIDAEGRETIFHHVPVGVVAAIVPWNYPIALAMMKLGPALLSGCTVIWKPAPTTPLSSLHFGELVRDMLPPGVLNIVSGSDRLGPWLTSHSGIDKVSFTGSTQTGRLVMKSAASTLKRITLELGGNDAAIVMPDVNVDAVAEKLFWAAFTNGGQICIASKRMYVHKDIYQPLMDALIAYAKTIKVGDGMEEGTRVGPLQNRVQYERVLELISEAKEKGFSIVLGGDQIESSGYFIPLTIIDNPPEDARIVQEEQFGPVLPLIKFDDIDDVVSRANNSEYGLGSSIWSSDVKAAREIASRMQSGLVWINETQYMTPHTPFSGHKQSGIGVENGIEGLMEFMLTQTIFVNSA